jgi:phosphate/sulfate permease
MDPTHIFAAIVIYLVVSGVIGLGLCDANHEYDGAHFLGYTLMWPVLLVIEIIKGIIYVITESFDGF